MALLSWGPHLMVGFKPIDDQHEKLISLVNALDAGVRAGYSLNILGAVLDELIRYTEYHFTFEERLMDTYRIAETEEHKAAHADLTAEVVAFRDRFLDGGGNAAMPLLRFLRDWLENHILKTDKNLAAALIAQGASAA